MNETIRIIGGLYRGKKLSFAAQPSLRPTPNRIRETLFNWLMHDLREADCLDAFAGSGALGFEAFSRGAKQVTLIEHDQPTYACLKKQAASFNTTQLTVLRADVCDFIQVTQQAFDIIFFDPPFSKPDYYAAINTLAATNCLKPGGLLYVEAPEACSLAPDQWETLKLKRAGQVVYGLYKKRG